MLNRQPLHRTRLEFLRPLLLSLLLIALLAGCQYPPASMAVEDSAAALATEPVPTSDTPIVTSPPWPGQDLLLLCQADGNNRLWRYRPDDQTWTDASFAALGSSCFMPLQLFALDAGQGVVVTGLQRMDDTFRFQAHWWSDGEARLLIEGPEETVLLPRMARSDLSADDVLYLAQATRPVPVEPAVFALDLASCRPDDCPLASVESMPVWSTSPMSAVWIAPLELDAEEFGYLLPMVPVPVASNGLPPVEMVLAAAGLPSDAASAAALTETLRTALAADPAAPAIASLTLFNARAVPHAPGRVLIAGIDVQAASPDQVFLFELDTATGQDRWIAELTTPAAAGLELSPNGRYLVAPEPTQLSLYDLETSQLMQYPQVMRQGYAAHAWSNDGMWLLALDSAQITLAVPSLAFSETINLAGQNCQSGVWISR